MNATYFVHGTSIDSRVWDPQVVSSILELFGGGKAKLIDWSGANNTQARKNAATELLDDVLQLSKNTPLTQLSLVGHSHGGSILLHASQGLREIMGQDTHIDLLTLNTPNVKGGAKLQDPSIHHYHVYCPTDIVVLRGGFSQTGVLNKGGERSNFFGKPIGGEWSSIKDKDSGKLGSAKLTFASAKANIFYKDQYRFKGFSPRTHWVSHRGWLKKNVNQWLPKLKWEIEGQRIETLKGRSASSM